MADESDKGKSPLDQLYDHALKQELELVAARAKVAQSNQWQPPSEEDFDENWYQPLDVLEVSDLRMADTEDLWAIVEQLRAGQIIAVARTAQVRADLVGVEPFVHVPAGAWRRMTDDDEDNFWKTGHLVVEAPDRTHTGYGRTGQKERYFNIKFYPGSFTGRPPPKLPDEAQRQAMPSDPVEVAQAERPERNKGGRPAYDYWEPLLIEMARQLYSGDLQPARQAQIEAAMQDWITAQGKKWSETQVRQRAKSLWEAIEKEVGK